MLRCEERSIRQQGWRADANCWVAPPGGDGGVFLETPTPRILEPPTVLGVSEATAALMRLPKEPGIRKRPRPLHKGQMSRVIPQLTCSRPRFGNHTQGPASGHLSVLYQGPPPFQEHNFTMRPILLCCRWLGAINFLLQDFKKLCNILTGYLTPKSTLKHINTGSHFPLN